MSENPFVAGESTATTDLIRAALWDGRTASRQLAERWAERFGPTTTTGTPAVHDNQKDT